MITVVCNVANYGELFSNAIKLCMQRKIPYKMFPSLDVTKGEVFVVNDQMIKREMEGNKDV
jgi:hypothetical protein